MFKNLISSTPLTDEFASGFFGDKIWGDNFNGDVTMTATLRALVYPRMGNDDVILIVQKTLRQPCVSTANALSVAGLNDGSYDKTLAIVNVCNPVQEEREKWFANFAESLVKQNEGWIRIEKVSKLFQQVFKVDCYVNEATKQSVVFADMVDARKYHYLQCGVFGYVPWYFDPSKGVSDLEMELLKSLREKTPDKYQSCIAAIAAQYNLDEMRLRKMLDGFESRYERRELQRANLSIESVISDINNYNDRIASKLREKRELEIRAAGLAKKIADGNENSDILELFLSNKHLLLRSVNDSNMTFVVMEDLAFFEEEAAQMLMNNESSYLYHPDTDGSRYIPKEDMKRFAQAVFIDQRLKIRMCAAYSFDMEGSVRAIGDYDYPPECSGYIPNPHIHHYHCLGSYSRYINDLLSKRDYTGAICQCIASCKSLNLNESPTMIKFMRTLYGVGGSGNGKKFVALPDGSVVSVKEACEWLKNEAEETAETEESEESNG